MLRGAPGQITEEEEEEGKKVASKGLEIFH